MGPMASQIASLTIVYSTVYSGTNQRKHQSSASLTFVRGIHRSPVNSPHKGPVTRVFSHLMTSSCPPFVVFCCGLVLGNFTYILQNWFPEPGGHFHFSINYTPFHIWVRYFVLHWLKVNISCAGIELIRFNIVNIMVCWCAGPLRGTSTHDIDYVA